MSFDTNTELDLDVDNNLTSSLDLEDFEVSGNRKSLGKESKNKYIVRQKLDLINEQRALNRQLDSFSSYWEL